MINWEEESRKKETVLKDGDCFYFDDTGIRIAEQYGYGNKYPLSTAYTFRTGNEEFFFRKDSQEIQAIWGKYGEKKTAVYLFLPSQRMAEDPFRMLKRTMHFF